MHPALADNPVLRQQYLRWRRLGIFSRILMLVVWLLLAVAIRVVLPQMLLGVAAPPGLMLTLIGGMLLSAFQFIMRPDILVVLLLYTLLVPLREWHELRTHLALSRISPVQLMVGLLAIPWLLLMALNLLGSVFFYHQIVLESLRLSGASLLSFVEGMAVAVLATVEDLLYISALATLVLRHRLRGEGFDHGLGGIVWRLALLGFAIALLSQTAFVFEILLTSVGVLLPPWRSYLVCSMIAMLLIYALELWVLRRWLVSCHAAATQWLAGDDAPRGA